MGFWMTLWKVVFIISVAAFSIMSLWVTIGGARDIRSLLALLREEHAAKQKANEKS